MHTHVNVPIRQFLPTGPGLQPRTRVEGSPVSLRRPRSGGARLSCSHEPSCRSAIYAPVRAAGNCTQHAGCIRATHGEGTEVCANVANASMSRVTFPGFDRAQRGSAPTRRLAKFDLTEQVDSSKTEVSGQPFDRPKAEVPQPLLDPTDVRAVVSKLLGELLLTQAKFLPVSPQVAPERALQVTFHSSSSATCYLPLYRFMSSGLRFKRPHAPSSPLPELHRLAVDRPIVRHATDALGLPAPPRSA